jgi:hypothetical protein
MDDPVAVTLIIVAVRVLRLGMAASAGVFDAHRIVGEHEKQFTVETGLPGFACAILIVN